MRLTITLRTGGQVIMQTTTLDLSDDLFEASDGESVYRAAVQAAEQQRQELSDE